MKKVVLMAAVVLSALAMTSCKKGSCSCIGRKTSSSTSLDLKEYREESGKDDADVCSTIRGNYSSEAKMECFKGSTMEEAEKTIQDRGGIIYAE